jgi:quinol monooxygenase YgiN
MIKIVAKNYIKAEKISDFIILAKKLVQETNKNDTGCIQYELFQDIKNPQILTIIEEWENKESLDLHMAAKHFKEIIPLFGDFVEQPSETNLYQIIK